MDPRVRGDDIYYDECITLFIILFIRVNPPKVRAYPCSILFNPCQSVFRSYLLSPSDETW